MATARQWKKWCTILGVAATALTIMGTLIGATWSVVADRFNVIQRIAIVEERAVQREKEAGDRLKAIDGRLETQDDRWTKLEPRLDALSQDVAVSKAILERLEKRLDKPLPAVDPFHRQPQKGQQNGALAVTD